MTLTQAIALVLRRVGLSTTQSSYKDIAREYLSLAIAETANMLPWWWLDQTTTFKTTNTLTVTSASGTFAAGETITGGTSGSTATVDAWDATNSLLYVYSPSASFTASETITGGTSGATATFSSSTETRVYRPVSSGVSAWHSFTDATNDDPLAIIGYDDYDLADLDRNETGALQAVLVGGLNADTGYPEIEVHPKPSTTNETIRARYRVDFLGWSSTDDSSNLRVLGVPRIIEGVIAWRASQWYKQEIGDEAGAISDGRNYAAFLATAKRQNLNMQGNRTYPSEPAGAGQDFQVRVTDALIEES